MQRLTLLFLVMISSAHAADLQINDDVKARLLQAIERGEIRAAVVGLFVDGEITVEGFGRISEDDATVPDGDTAFEIGSISKVFTALLTEVQARKGELSWDDTIGQHLSNLKFANRDVASIRLQELASHTSGLPRLPDNMKPSDPLDPYAGYEREHLLAYLGSFDPDKLEKAYAYSNLGAGLLGEIAADAAQASYADAMHHDVFKPLDMKSSAVGLRKTRATNLAAGFSQGATMPNWAGFDALAGAGAIVSTVNDQLKFAEQSLSGNALAGALAAIQAPQPNGETGLGWHLDSHTSGETILWHNGGTGGYASFLAIDRSQRRAIVLLTTSTAYNTVTELGFAQAKGTSIAPDNQGDLEPFFGTYELAKGFLMTIFERDGRLMGQATGQGAFPLTPTNPNEYSFPAANIRIVFEDVDNGQAQKLTLYQGGQITLAPRTEDEGVIQYEEIEIPADKLEQFVGRYQLAPGVVIAVELREDQLFAQLTGQTAYPVFAYAPDKFFYRVVDAQLHFEFGDQNEVQAVVLHQNGQQRAPRID